MSISVIDFDPLAVEVSFTSSAMHVVLADGREVSVPLEWLPVLRNATPEQRKKWELIGDGVGICWPDLDVDVLVEDLLVCRRR